MIPRGRRCSSACKARRNPPLFYLIKMAFTGSFPLNDDRTSHSGVPTSPHYERRSSEAFGNRFIHRRESSMQGHGATSSSETDRRSIDSDTVDRDLEDMALEREEQESGVRELARQWTRHSTAEVLGHPLQYEKDSPLDPESDHFDPRAWTKSLLHLAKNDSEHFKFRQAGVSFKNLGVHGFGSAADFQKSVGTIGFQALDLAKKVLGHKGRRVNILQNLDGLVRPGEMLVVLGPPGSGCSTFLKTLAGETHGFTVDSASHVNYQGISYEQMQKNFRGEAIYTAEQDVHFPYLTVGDTLYFAARARCPRVVPGGATKHQYADMMRNVIMATFGIRHTINTRVGNEYVRGVSGGERKRVSIAEASLSYAPLQMWDNSTRGLDSANAIEFCRNLRVQTEVNDVAVAVAIYQAPQTAYEIFDKVIVLYEGRQIFFGSTKTAKQYFINLGFECPDRQTDADFLTSMTSSVERIVQSGYEHKVPRTPDEFADRWRQSKEYQELKEDIARFEEAHPFGGADLQQFSESRKLQQAKYANPKSPYTLSYTQQVRLCLWRAFVQLKGDPSITLTQLLGNQVMALIISSVFYNLRSDAGSFFSRSALLFFAIMMSAFGSALEILTRYAQRPIVEKHVRYALYYPSAEALASMICDLPYKITNTILFNVTVYFMTNLRREAGAFFFFLLFSFVMMLTMSMMFRGIASISRTLEQAMAPGSLLMLALVMYTGFAIPTTYMLGWARWYVPKISIPPDQTLANSDSYKDQLSQPRCVRVRVSDDQRVFRARLCVLGSVTGPKLQQCYFGKSGLLSRWCRRRTNIRHW
jgi:ATP-binding cassette subfamily G (WHITE) protein 2 (PDR)